MKIKKIFQGLFKTIFYKLFKLCYGKIREINNQSEVSFEIDFEIKNIFYNMIMKKSFDHGLRNIADAFEKRAIKLFKKT